MGLLAVQVLFGVNYVVSKMILGYFPPLVWAVIRMALAATVMLSVLSVTRRHLYPKDGWKFYGPLALLSVFGIILNQSLFLLGLKHTTATNSAVLNVLTPVFTMLIMTLRGHERRDASRYRRYFGFFLAFAGVLAIRKIEEIKFSNETFLGDFLTILNCLSFSIFLTISQKFFQAHDRLWSTAWMFIYATIGIGLMSAGSWSGFVFPPMTWELGVAIFFAVVGATVLTYFLNAWALTYANPVHVSLGIYIQPVIAALLAWSMFDEKITVRTALSSLLIFVGLFLVLVRGPNPTSSKVIEGKPA